MSKGFHAIDYAVLMKVLPKFHGPRQKLEMPLWQVVNWCLRGKQDTEKQDTDSDNFIARIWQKVTQSNELQPSGKAIADYLRDWNNRKTSFRFPNTAKKALQMLRQLYETGFASFAG